MDICFNVDSRCGWVKRLFSGNIPEIGCFIGVKTIILKAIFFGNDTTLNIGFSKKGNKVSERHVKRQGRIGYQTVNSKMLHNDGCRKENQL